VRRANEVTWQQAAGFPQANSQQWPRRQQSTQTKHRQGLCVKVPEGVTPHASSLRPSPLQCQTEQGGQDKRQPERADDSGAVGRSNCTEKYMPRNDTAPAITQPSASRGPMRRENSMPPTDGTIR
jgi:hypothetical protein